MSITRIKAILLQELYITANALEVIMDIFFFPAMNVIVFGFISIYLSGSESGASDYLLMGILLWQIIYITQYSISVGSLWNVWSRNLSNIFISPISIKEYLSAYVLSGTIKALLTFILFSFIAYLVFDFNILRLGPVSLTLSFINLVLFAVATGIAILGAIFRFGTRIQSLAWGLIFLFQPLTAAFFPLSVLPNWLQKIALLFPPTFVFEAARFGIKTGAVNYRLYTFSFIENTIYLAVALIFFNYMFKKAKDTGQFARNEG